jgi:homogentisate 1,2-dioxygenase
MVPPTPLLENADMRMSWWALNETPDWYLREADGDVCYFVHAGDGVLETELGDLDYRAGDFLLMPRSITHRFVVGGSTQVLCVQSLGNIIRLPDRGLLGRHALFDPAILDVPEPNGRDEAGEYQILVRRGTQQAVVTYPFHPFDVVGWKGDIAPVRLHVDDFRPINAHRYHMPPSAHTTFVSSNFVIATFAPRPLETDPDVLRLPFYHRNVDYDEVILYHRGEFFSRAGLVEGMMTFHPYGVHHGPQPKAVERSKERGPGGFADEVAINIDSRNPLSLTPEGEAICVAGYENSWLSEEVDA